MLLLRRKPSLPRKACVLECDVHRGGAQLGVPDLILRPLASLIPISSRFCMRARYTGYIISCRGRCGETASGSRVVERDDRDPTRSWGRTAGTLPTLQIRGGEYPPLGVAKESSLRARLFSCAVHRGAWVAITRMATPTFGHCREFESHYCTYI